MTNEERLQILQKVENGEVSVEDAIGMMSPAQAKESSSQPDRPGSGRWLRVRVTNLETGKRKVSVNVPLGLMRWGLAVGSRFAPELEDLDWEAMVTDLDQYAEGFLVEVEDNDDNERVEVYIE